MDKTDISNDRNKKRTKPCFWERESMENHQLGDLDVDRCNDINETGLWDS